MRRKIDRVDCRDHRQIIRAKFLFEIDVPVLHRHRRHISSVWFYFLYQFLEVVVKHNLRACKVNASTN